MSAETRVVLNAKMESLYKTFSQISNSSLSQRIANSDIWTGGSGSAIASQSSIKEGADGLSSPQVAVSQGPLSPIVPPPDNAEIGDSQPSTPKQQTGLAERTYGIVSEGLDGSPASNADVAVSDEDKEKQGSSSRRVSFKKTTLNKEQLLPRPTKCEEYRSFFHLPPDENLIEDFNCALQKKILLQGHMYLFDGYVCFYSNIFGYEKKKVLPLRDITVVRKAKTAAVFPNAIEIVAWGKRHFFASFLSRDEAYRLIILNWSMHSGYAKLFLGNRLNIEVNGLPGARSDMSTRREDEDEDAETLTFAETAITAAADMVEEVRGTDTLDLPGVDSTGVPAGSPPEGVQLEAPDDQEMRQEASKERAVAKQVVREARVPSGLQAMPWEVEDIEPPEVPDTFKTIMDTELSVSSKDMFQFFFSDEASEFLYNFHTARGDQEFRCSPWQTDPQYGHVRELSFRHPINFYFGPKSTFCRQTQSFRVCRRNHVVIYTSQTMQDIPYGDYFSVEVRWDIEDLKGRGPDCCNLRISLDVPFTKKTVWKGKIEQGTLDESRETYQAWVQEAQTAILDARGDSRDGTPLRAATPVRQSSSSGVPSAVTNDEVLNHLEGKIPVEYEQEIRRMLKLDGASRSQSTAHSPRLSTTHMPSPGQSVRSDPTTPVPLKAGTGDAFGEGTSARVSLPGAWLVQGFKAVVGRLVESEKVAYQLKAGVAVLVLAILLLLQAYFFLWARSPSSAIDLTSSVGGLGGISYAHPCLSEGTCHLPDLGGNDDWLRGYWEQRFRFMREEMNLVEQRLHSLNREFAAAKAQFQADMVKTEGHRGRDLVEPTGADESVS